MKVVVLARTESPRIEDTDIDFSVDGMKMSLAVFDEEDVSREKFREKIKELRKKYCKIFRTDQLTMLVPKKEVKYVE